MKWFAVNTFILMTCVAILHTVVFFGGAYLLSPGHLLIPRPLPTATILDLLILCVLPAIFTSAAYVATFILFKDLKIEHINSFLNIMPLILLISVILAVDDIFGHAVRDFSERDFFSYTTLLGTAFVFPNISRIWLVAIFVSIILSILKQEFVPTCKPTTLNSGAHSKKVAKNGHNSTLYYTAAFLMPSVLLFDLYNRNRVENHIVFTHVLILAGVLAILGTLLFLAFKQVAKSSEVALLLCLLFWLCFWLFEALFGIVAIFYATISSTRLIMMLVAVLVFSVMMFRRYEPPFVKVRPVFNALAISLVALFIFNMLPGVNHEFMLHHVKVAGLNEEDAPFYIKREFFIDQALPSPDIYWVHVDGMMSMETVERFWGVSQEHLREDLAYRGFMVYPNAELNAGYTASALAALLSPAFYDSFFRVLLDETETELRVSRQRSNTDALAQVGLTFRYVSLYYELLSALIERGYEIQGRDSNHLVARYTGLWHSFLGSAGDLPELLNLTTPLSITPITERIEIVAGQPNYDCEPQARFIWRGYIDTHVHQFWRHDPTLTARDYTAIHVYPLAYAQIARRALNFVDTILEENPNAVIIIQADHGFHSDVTQLHLLNQGYSLEFVMELVHSVFSAVRMPPKYGGLDSPIAPLNISRELVNRFVGENSGGQFCFQIFYYRIHCRGRITYRHSMVN